VVLLPFSGIWLIRSLHCFTSKKTCKLYLWVCGVSRKALLVRHMSRESACGGVFWGPKRPCKRSGRGRPSAPQRRRLRRDACWLAEGPRLFPQVACSSAPISSLSSFLLPCAWFPGVFLAMPQIPLNRARCRCYNSKLSSCNLRRAGGRVFQQLWKWLCKRPCLSSVLGLYLPLL